MPLPASDFWTKIQKELSGKANPEQIAILQRYLDTWPNEWKGPYQELKERLLKLVRKLQTTESVKSSSAREDPFHVPRGGDGQVALIGPTNAGKSALVATLTHARLDISDYPFTTHVPSPGMLHYLDAAIQLIDTPAIVAGLGEGAGAGPRLIQLIRTMNAVGIVVDLAQEPLAQIEVVRQELTEANIVLTPHPLATVLEMKGKGGIRFRGREISKTERLVATQMLAEQKIVHAEVIVRAQFAPEELAAQLAHQWVLPTMIIGTKNDTPGAADAYKQVQTHYPDYTVVDVNFLDETNFDRLRAALFEILGLIRVYLLERPAMDAPHTPLILERSSSISDITDHFVSARVWGPSAKYPGQAVGLEHLLADGDLIHLPS